MNRPTRRSLATILCAALAALLLSTCAGAPSPEPPAPPPVTREAPAPEGLAPAGGKDAATGTPAPAPAVEPKKAETELRSADAAATGAPGWASEESVRGMASPAAAPSSTAASRPAPTQSGLSAGYADDNEQFNLFLKFQGEHPDTDPRALQVRERIQVAVKDAAGLPVANAAVTVSAGGRVLARGKTYADGVFSLYPLEYGVQAESFELAVSGSGGAAKLAVERGGPRSLSLALPGARRVLAPLPVDILFILDTTGSMGEEIERLRATIEIINTNLAALKPRPDLRFGLVLYKDREDEYVTELHPFTAKLDGFQRVLDGVSAGGGGDTPEDLQAALEDAVEKMDWRPEGLRLAFTITDAPAHEDYGQAYDFRKAAREAAARAIKIYGIGTGGLPLEGELILRRVAQYTRARYIFLTYGETGEAAGGAEGSVSHHTGTNFSTDKLEAVIIRFAREEIARFSDKPLAFDESFYQADKRASESREDTLDSLFVQALGNLNDYSALRLSPETRLALMPFAVPAGAEGAALARQAEYFGAQAALAAAKSKLFSLVERKDLQKILGELELQLSGLADEDAAAKVGRLLGAEVLVTGELYEKEGRYELFLKLLRVETAEVLAATKARIDRGLGLD